MLPSVVSIWESEEQQRRYYLLRRRGPPGNFVKKLFLVVSAREGGSREVLISPADNCQELVRSLSDSDLVLINEVAIDAKRASGGFQELLDLCKDRLSATDIQSEGDKNFIQLYIFVCI